jgi:hypothetical protein
MSLRTRSIVLLGVAVVGMPLWTAAWAFFGESLFRNQLTLFLYMLVYGGGFVAGTACVVRAIPTGSVERFAAAVAYVLVMAFITVWIGLWASCSSGDCL